MNDESIFSFALQVEVKWSLKKKKKKKQQY